MLVKDVGEEEVALSRSTETGVCFAVRLISKPKVTVALLSDTCFSFVDGGGKYKHAGTAEICLRVCKVVKIPFKITAIYVESHVFLIVKRALWRLK